LLTGSSLEDGVEELGVLDELDVVLDEELSLDVVEFPVVLSEALVTEEVVVEVFAVLEDVTCETRLLSD
jgi:hypothetical protein